MNERNDFSYIQALQQRLDSMGQREEMQENATIVELKQRIKTMMEEEHLQQKMSANANLTQVCPWLTCCFGMIDMLRYVDAKKHTKKQKKSSVN